MEKKYDVFISYRRDGGESTARVIRDRLVGMGYRVFFDVESLRSGAFNTKLYSVIEECRDVVVVLSPHALDRCVNEDDWVRQEIQHALARKKNVVPVLLRNFDFPQTLPPSLEPLRYQNGVAANAEYFDAFIEKLTEFLESKQVRRRYRWGIAAVITALLLITLALGPGIWRWGQYPRSQAEKNLTEEVIYHTSQTLVQFDLLVQSQQDVFQVVRLFLETGESDRETAAYLLDEARRKVGTLDVGEVRPEDSFMIRLENSPFESAEMIAMHDELSRFQQESLDILDYMEFLVDPACMMSSIEKRAKLEAYEAYLEENGKVFAYCTNQMLLPVTQKDAMQTFWTETMPEINHVPLSALNWEEEELVLESVILECINKMKEAIESLALIQGSMEEKLTREQEEAAQKLMAMGFTPEGAERIVHDMVFDYEAEKENLIQKYMRQGHTEEEAGSRADMQIQSLQLQAQTRRKYSALTTDDPETLWVKMIYLLDHQLYTESRECMDLYAQVVQDENAARYLPAVRLFIDQMEAGGPDYGLVVIDCEDGELPTALQVGDVIQALNGQPCSHRDAYGKYKSAVDGNEFTVTVLRVNSSGQLEPVDLEMTMEMSAVSCKVLMTE